MDKVDGSTLKAAGSSQDHPDLEVITDVAPETQISTAQTVETDIQQPLAP